MRPFFLLTVVFGALPFLLYAWERSAGYLPGPDEWLLQGINHGPWRWQAEGFTVGLPLLAIAAVTLATAVGLAVRRRSVGILGKGLALVALQAVLLFAQLRVLFWTID